MGKSGVTVPVPVTVTVILRSAPYPRFDPYTQACRAVGKSELEVTVIQRMFTPRVS